MQTGHIYKKVNKKGKGSWYLRYWDTIIQPDGSAKRKLVTKQLAPYPEYRSKDSVKPLAVEFLSPLNSGKLRPESTMTLAQFVEHHFLPHVEKTNKPSTYNGYQEMWKDHLAGRCGHMRLREFRCCDGDRLLADVVRQKDLARSSARKLKAILSCVFKFAKQQGVLDGINPMVDVSIPVCKPPIETHAYSLNEILSMLNVLSGRAHLVVMTAAFTGLRECELRGLRWEEYTGAEISVSRSAWKTHVTEPKTPKSKAPVPVISILADKLNQYRQSLGNPQSGWIFESRNGKPLNLDNLATREIRPLLKAAGLRFYGWHAFRRGLATNLIALGVEPKTVQAILRHSNVLTTLNLYAKSIPEQSVHAMRNLEELFTQCSPTQAVN